MTGQFGDTTFTKVFVGGLAWETQKETMSQYFQQFGEILEAVVISDKNTGRSKGYGFVTFRDPDAATRACVDPSPVIDGRRANCNLAYLGVNKSRPTSPKAGSGKSFRTTTKPLYNVGLQAFTSAGSYPHYGIPQGIPYGVYGYSQYSPDYAAYPTGYYNFYGSAAQYPLYGGATGVVPGGGGGGGSAFYPFYQLSHGGGAGCTTTPTYTQGQVYGRPYSSLYPYSTLMPTTAAVSGFAPQQHGVFANPASPPPAAGIRAVLPLQLS